MTKVDPLNLPISPFDPEEFTANLQACFVDQCTESDTSPGFNYAAGFDTEHDGSGASLNNFAVCVRNMGSSRELFSISIVDKMALDRVDASDGFWSDARKKNILDGADFIVANESDMGYAVRVLIDFVWVTFNPYNGPRLVWVSDTAGTDLWCVNHAISKCVAKNIDSSPTCPPMHMGAGNKYRGDNFTCCQWIQGNPEPNAHCAKEDARWISMQYCAASAFHNSNLVKH
jgi:hypothetical protein